MGWRALAWLGSMVTLTGCMVTPDQVPLTRELPLAVHTRALAVVDGSAWNLKQIEAAPEPGGEPVVVAVFDTGADGSHPGLAARVFPPIDVVGTDHDLTGATHIDYTGRDGNGHGTHVAGIVRDVAGPADVWVLPVKVIPHDGQGNDRWLAQGIQRALAWRAPGRPSLRARVFNLSVASPAYSDRLAEAVRAAQAAGVLVVGASGNEGGPVAFPASMAEVLSVGATGEDGSWASYSCQGDALDLVAPGGTDAAPVEAAWPTFVTSAERATGWATPSLRAGLVGTSMAAPHVSAAAAVLWGQHPGLTARQVRSCLLTAAEDLGPPGPDGRYGFGRLNVARALRMASRDDLQ